jgi:TRAP-type transport system periplasmic protein
MHQIRKGALAAKWSTALACAAAMSLLVAAPERSVAADKTFVLKLSSPTINDTQHHWMKVFAAAVEKDSGGRIKVELYPASQLGSIPRQIEGTQFGAIQGFVLPPEFLVGIDPRFELPSAPGLVESNPQAGRLVADPAVQKLMLSLGGNKGLHGVAFFIAQPTAIISRTPLRHLADFKGKKIRVLAAQFQQDMISRLGGTPVAMTLGDVLPAIQQGAVDGALAAITIFTTMQYYDAAKYVTETGQPFIFSITELSRKWYESLPKDLQKILDEDGKKAGEALTPWATEFYESQRKTWLAKNGELISLPPEEQATLIKMLDSIDEDVIKAKPALKEAYDTLTAAAKRAK